LRISYILRHPFWHGNCSHHREAPREDGNYGQQRAHTPGGFGPFGPEDLKQRLEEGWKPVAIEWEREVESLAAGHSAPGPEVPFGLRVAGDCSHLEENPTEREVLFQIMELTSRTAPTPASPRSLNRRGFRTRHGNRWTPVSVFQMLPRLIEAGPGILNSDEWRQRRQRLKIAAK